MSAKIDTTPDYPEQPASLVDAAERDLPAVLQEMPNETGNGASDPGHGHRVVLAEKLVEAMAGQKGHGKAAAAWAIHRLAERGLLRCEVGREFYPRVVGQRQVPGRMMFGVQRSREEPVYGTKEVPLADPAAGPVPFRSLLLYSTEQLWEWWRSLEVMKPTDPDMDGILRQVQAKREQGEAAERLYRERLARWTRLRDTFQEAAGFRMEDYATELGRSPTKDEFYRGWAERLAAFGRAIQEHDLVGWVEREYNPDSLDGQWTRGLLLRACRTPDDLAGLQEVLVKSGSEPELHAVRHRLRDVGKLLLKEAGTALTKNEDADPRGRDLAILREECRSRGLALDVWNVTQHGNPSFPEDCVRELWQKVREVAYGSVQKAPPKEPDQVPDVPAAHRALDEVMRWCEDHERNAGQATQVTQGAVEPASHMAELSLAQNQAVAGLADLFVDYDFLPNSGASYTWREAAAENGLVDYWQEGSKRPVIVRLLESALQHQPDSFCGLICTVVRRGIRRRQGKHSQSYPPITHEAIANLNRLLSAAGFEVPAELNAPAFLDSLPPGQQDAQQQTAPELPRQLVQDYLLGKVRLTPEQERQFLGFDPGEVVEVRHPEAEELERWAGLAGVKGKFCPGWWELSAACRFWRIPTDGEPNHWMPVIADCMRELFGRPLLEEDLLGYLFRQHRKSPSQAASLSLADLANLLREDCDRHRTDCGSETSPPAPHELLPEAVEDLPAYKAEEQPWGTPLPATRDVVSDELVSLAGEIDLVIITATDPEVEAVLRRLEPYPRRRAILKGFVEQETYYLGRFGSCLAAVTKCRMGSLDSGAATLATQHAQRVWRPRAVVMVGIALGKDPAKQKIADVLVASQVISYEPQRVGETQVVPRGPITPASTTLLNRFENVPHWSFCRPDGSRCERHVGPLLSGEKLVDDPAFKAELFDRYPQAIGGDMEGVGLAAAAVRHGVPWILVKAICDWADGKKHKKHQPLAAAAAVSLINHVLSQADVLHGLDKPRQG